MRKWIALIAAAAVLVIAWVGMTHFSRRDSLGCRIWADGVLIYEGTGQRLEDVVMQLRQPVRQLRIEYTGPEGASYPVIDLQLPTESMTP